MAGQGGERVLQARAAEVDSVIVRQAHGVDAERCERLRRLPRITPVQVVLSLERRLSPTGQRRLQIDDREIGPIEQGAKPFERSQVA